MISKKKVTIEVGDGAAIPRKKDRGIVDAWWLSFIGAIVVISYLCLAKPEPYLRILKFVFGEIKSTPWETLLSLWDSGVGVTFRVTILSIMVALVLGLITGLGRLSRNRLINLIASTYVEVVRGIPLLVQLFYLYFALGHVFRNLPSLEEAQVLFAAWPGFVTYLLSHGCDELKNMSPLVSAVSAMGICYGAYMGEVFRAGIESIDKGQTEASRSLGFTRAQTMFMVILPQAWRTILPPVGNEFIALLKDSSLVSILAVSDLLRRGREFASESFMYFEAYTMVALVYLVITLFLSKAVSKMEQRLNYYERD